MKNLKSLLSLVAVLILLASCAIEKSAVNYHEGLQREATFENRLNANKAFTLSSANSTLKDVKQDKKELEKKQKAQAKVDAVYEEIRKVKEEIEKAKQN